MINTMLNNNNKEKSNIFKAFCDEKRLEILAFLQGGEKCGCDIIEHIKLRQSAVSYHMKILCESGIVESRQVGKWVHYKISESGCAYAKNILAEVTSTSDIITNKKSKVI